MSKAVQNTFGVISIVFLGITAAYTLIISLFADGPSIWGNVGVFLLHVLAVGSIFFLFYDLSENEKTAKWFVIIFSILIFLFFVTTFWSVNFGNPDPNTYVFFAIQSYPILYLLFATVWSRAKVLFYKIITRLFLFLSIVGYGLLFDANYGLGEGANSLLIAAFILLILPGVWVVARSLKW